MDDGEMSLDEANALVGDDIHYWMNNPFLDADHRTAKVLSWLGRARDQNE